MDFTAFYNRVVLENSNKINKNYGGYYQNYLTFKIIGHPLSCKKIIYNQKTIFKLGYGL